MYLFSHNMTIDFDMFGVLIIDWVSYIWSAQKMRVGPWWTTHKSKQKQWEKPNDLTSSVGHRTIFRFCRRTWHNLLLLTLPRNERRTKKHTRTTNREVSIELRYYNILDQCEPSFDTTTLPISMHFQWLKKALSLKLRDMDHKNCWTYTIFSNYPYPCTSNG